MSEITVYKQQGVESYETDYWTFDNGWLSMAFTDDLTQGFKRIVAIPSYEIKKVVVDNDESSRPA